MARLHLDTHSIPTQEAPRISRSSTVGPGSQVAKRCHGQVGTENGGFYQVLHARDGRSREVPSRQELAEGFKVHLGLQDSEASYFKRFKTAIAADNCRRDAL